MRLSFWALLAICSSLMCCNRGRNLVVNMDESMTDTLSVGEIFDTIEVIRLEIDEEDRMVKGGMYIACFGDSIFFVLDKYNGNTIRAFDYSGKLVGKMSPNNKDDGHYTIAYDLLVDDERGLLILLDPRGKVVRYSLSDGFPFVDEYDFSDKIPAVHNIGKLSDGSYLLFSRSAKNQLYVLSFENKRLTPIRYAIPHWLLSSPFLVAPSPFYTYNGETYYFDGINGDIYSVYHRHLCLRYKWNFGDNQINRKQIPPNKTLLYYRKLVKHISYRWATQFSVVQETDRYVFVHFVYGNQGSLLLYDKINDAVQTLRRTKEGLKIIPGAFVNGSMFLLAQTEYVSQFCEMQSLADSDSSGYCILKYSLK